MKEINRLTSWIILRSKIVTFVTKRAFSEDENLWKFKDKINIGYGEFNR